MGGALSPPTERPGRELPAALLWGAAGVVLLLVVAFGWVSDDAYVTLRSVDLTWRGYGPVWNVDERVQAYTHPLWFGVLLVSYGLTGLQAWWAAFLPGVLATGAALVLGLLALRDRPGRALVFLGCVGASRAFLEYGTSGLENPATFALLAGIVLARRRRTGWARLAWVSGLAGLAVLNRLDTALLVAPLWLWTAWEERELGLGRIVGLALLAAVPLAAWEVFSLVYYGFPVPNTAYAKLGTGMPLGVKLRMGMTYLTHAALHDPLGGVVIATAAIGGILSREPRARPLLAAIALYLAYIIWIGGDFMAGRFVSAPVLLAAFVVAELPAPTRLSSRLAVALPWLAVALTQLVVTVHPQRLLQEQALVERGPYEAARLFGIVDERSYFRSTTGLLAVLAAGGEPERITRTEGEKVAAEAARTGEPVVTTPAQAGMFAYYGGPGMIAVDLYGLGDPLMARIPMTTGPKRGWAPGHFPRRYPAGYLDGRTTRSNTLEDPDLRAYNAVLHEVTSGPLLAGPRWQAMLELWTGVHADKVAAYASRIPVEEDPDEDAP